MCVCVYFLDPAIVSVLNIFQFALIRISVTLCFAKVLSYSIDADVLQKYLCFSFFLSPAHSVKVYI